MPRRAQVAAAGLLGPSPSFLSGFPNGFPWAGLASSLHVGTSPFATRYEPPAFWPADPCVGFRSKPSAAAIVLAHTPRGPYSPWTSVFSVASSLMSNSFPPQSRMPILASVASPSALVLFVGCRRVHLACPFFLTRSCQVYALVDYGRLTPPLFVPFFPFVEDLRDHGKGPT